MDIFLRTSGVVARYHYVTYLIIALILFSGSTTVRANQPQLIESNGFQYSIAPAAEWVRDSQYGMSDSQSPETVRYLLVDQQVMFRNGDATVYNRNVEQPLTTEGVAQSSRIEVSFNPVYQKLVWHNVTVKRGAKEMNRLSSSTITLLQREESLDQEIVDGYVTAMLVIHDTRKGDVIDYSYSIEGRNPIYGKHAFFNTFMGWTVPVAKLNRRFIFDNNRHIQYKLDQFDDKPIISEKNGLTEYQWTLENTKAIFVEKDYPTWYRPYPQLSFSSFDSWKDVSNWAKPLYANRRISSPELLNFIAEIKPLKQKEQIVKALQFVQGEIRYLGVELGVNSHMPHDPDEVFKNRFGDCKDKTLLLIAILDKLDIRAYPALVSTFGTVNLPNELPSPAEFNHVITRVEVGSQTYWLDPTRNLQNGLLDSIGYRSYDNALVIGHPYLGLVEMPQTAQKLAEIHTREYFNVIAYEAPVDYRIVTEYSGIEAEYIHAQFVNQGQAAMERKFLNYMNRIYPDLQADSPLTFTYDLEKNIATVVESYRLTDFFRKQPERLLADIYPYSIADYFALPTTVKRKTPLRHFYPIKVTHQSQVHYPEWIKMSLPNNTQSIETPYFSIDFSEDYRDRSIITNYVYESKASFIPIQDVSEHIIQLRNAKDKLAKVYEITYTKNPREQMLGEFIEHLNKQVDSVTGVKP